MSSDKNFFWHGVLSLNELGAHAFFDVKIKKNVPDAPNNVGLFTSDLPPLPLTGSDTFHVTFLLENNVGLNTVRYRVVESQFSGAELMRAVEEAPSPSPTITVTSENGEWQFSLQQQTWILRSILLYVPMAQLRKFIKDP
jgi:hypothetical protein